MVLTEDYWWDKIPTLRKDDGSLDLEGVLTDRPMSVIMPLEMIMTNIGEVGKELQNFAPPKALEV